MPLLATVLKRCLALALFIVAAGAGACGNNAGEGSAGELRQAQQLLERGDTRAAIKLLERALASGQKAPALGLLAVAFEVSRDYDLAAATYAKLVRLRPEDTMAFTHHGRALAIGGRNREALTALDRARELDPRNPEALVLRAALTEDSTALAEFGEQLDALPKPDSAEVGVMRADIAAATGSPQEARMAREQLDKLELASPSSAAALAELLRRRGRWAAVEQLLSKLHKQTPLPPATALQLVEAALQQKHVDVARAALADLPTAADAPAGVLVARARVAIADGKLDEARADLSQALPKLSGVARDAARFRLAKVLLALGESATLESELRKLLTAGVGFVGAAMMLCDLLEGTGRTHEISEVLAPLIEQHPDAMPLYARLGQAQLQQGEGEAARATFAILAAKTPDDPRGPFLLGAALRQLGKREAAREQFIVSLARRPGQPGPIAALVAMATDDKDPERAKKLLAGQITQDPDNPTLHRLSGEFHAQHGDMEVAEGAFRQAVRVAPNDSQGWFQLGEFLHKAGRSEAGREAFDKGLGADPQDLGGWIRLGDLAYLAGDGQQAKQAFERALALEPTLVHAQNNIALILAQEGTDLVRAEQLAEAAHRAAPEQAAVADTVAWIYHLRGKSAQALPLLQQASEKLEDPATLYHLGEAYLATGHEDEARRSLQRALRKSSDFPGAANARATLAKLGG